MNRIPLYQDSIIEEFLQRLRQHLGDRLKEVIGKNVYRNESISEQKG